MGKIKNVQNQIISSNTHKNFKNPYLNFKFICMEKHSYLYYLLVGV